MSIAGLSLRGDFLKASSVDIFSAWGNINEELLIDEQEKKQLCTAINKHVNDILRAFVHGKLYDSQKKKLSKIEFVNRLTALPLYDLRRSVSACIRCLSSHASGVGGYVQFYSAEIEMTIPDVPASLKSSPVTRPDLIFLKEELIEMENCEENIQQCVRIVRKEILHETCVELRICAFVSKIIVEYH